MDRHRPHLPWCDQWCNAASTMISALVVWSCSSHLVVWWAFESIASSLIFLEGSGLQSKCWRVWGKKCNLKCNLANTRNAVFVCLYEPNWLLETGVPKEHTLPKIMRLVCYQWSFVIRLCEFRTVRSWHVSTWKYRAENMYLFSTNVDFIQVSVKFIDTTALLS